jgi:hypothetical protein
MTRNYTTKLGNWNTFLAHVFLLMDYILIKNLKFPLAKQPIKSLEIIVAMATTQIIL